MDRIVLDVKSTSLTVGEWVQEPLLGAFPFHSGKAERMHHANQGRCIAYMFVMRVQEELAVWPEAGQRERVWVRTYSPPGLALIGGEMMQQVCRNGFTADVKRAVQANSFS